MPTVICKNKELIPARSLKVIECTSKQKYHNIDHYAVDRHDDIALSLPNGLVVANCIVCVKSECILCSKVNNAGFPVQIVNMSEHDIYLAPRTHLGVLQPIEPIPVGNSVTIVDINEHEACI